MSLREKNSFEHCIDEELSDLANKNVMSVLVKTFVNCYTLFREDRTSYISDFSRRVAQALYRDFTCNRIKLLLERASTYMETIYREMSSIFNAVFAIDIKLTSRLTVYTRNPFLPLEISLAWDSVLNLPYIPSSSIKGAVRSWIESIGIVNIDGIDIKEIFGPSTKEELKYMGLAVFTDAYPISCVDHLIEPDVITSHYSYTRLAISEVESSPTPLVFPTIAPQTVLRVVIAFNYERGDKQVLNTSIVFKLIEHIMKGLEEGLGAKTNIGYGRAKTVISTTNTKLGDTAS